MAVKKKRKLSGLVAYSYLKDGSFRTVGLRSGASPSEILVSTPPPPRYVELSLSFEERDG